MSKDCFIDVETTGLDERVNGIIQISGEICAEDVSVFNFFVRPFPGDAIDEKALLVTGTKEEDLMNGDKYLDPAVVHSELLKIFSRHVDKFDGDDKMRFIAYNASFDYRFVRRFFERCGDKYFGSWFSFPFIDVMVLAGEYLKDEMHKLRDFKLATVAEYLGIDVDPSRLHDSSYDIWLMKEVYSKCGMSR